MFIAAKIRCFVQQSVLLQFRYRMALKTEFQQRNTTKKKINTANLSFSVRSFKSFSDPIHVSSAIPNDFFFKKECVE